MGRHIRLRAFAFALVLLASGAAVAQAPSVRVDQNDARGAAQRGEILPLSRVLALAQRAVSGEVLEVELERDDGRLVYEIEILARDGHIRTVELDARTGALIDLDMEDD